MLVELGKYEPFGQKFMDLRPHLGEDSALNPVIDFSSIDFSSPTGTPPSAPQFHNLFSISDNPTMDIGDPLDERRPDQVGKIENPALELEQEVYVKGSTVIWSRAGCVMKTFDYSSEDQPIQQVLLAWFPVHTILDPTNKPALDTIPDDIDGDKRYVDGYWDKRGPQSIIKYNIISANNSVIDDNSNILTNQQQQQQQYQQDSQDTKSDSTHHLQRRALCIVFQNCIKIHFEDGIHVTSQVPFDIGNVVPLDIGLLVSRKHVSLVSNDKMKRGKGKAGLSTLTSGARIKHGGSAKSKFDKGRTANQGVTFGATTTVGGSEFSSFFVTVTHPLRGSCPVKVKDTAHTTGISNLPEPLTSPQKLLFATTKSSETGRLPVIVTLNVKENKHCIWTYERRKEKSTPIVPLGGAATTTRRKSSIPSAPNTPTMAKRKLSKSTINYNQPVTPNRNKKQKSSMFDEPLKSLPQFHEDYVSDEENGPENELDKDIYHELLDPSEISLRLLWRESHGSKIPTKLKGIKDISSKAFLIHDLDGQEMICILNYTLGSLQVINLSKATRLLSNCIEFKSAAKSAVPINATRDSYNDLLFTDAAGGLQLFIDTKIPRLPIQLPSSPPGNLTKLIDSIYDRVTAVFDNGDMLRYQMQFRPESSLVRDCLVAIDCATTHYLPIIWCRFLNLSQFQTLESDIDRVKVSEWEMFVVALLSFFPLKKNGYYTGTKKAATSQAAMRDIQLQQIKASNVEYFNTELGFPTAYSLASYEFLLDENYIQGIPAHWLDQVVNFKSDEYIHSMILADIVNSLHVVYEDYRIKKSMRVHATLLGYLLLQCAVILGSKERIEYYKSQGINPAFTGNLQLKDKEMRESLIEPPNIQVCLRQMTPNISSNPTLLSSFGVNTLEPSFSHCQHTYAQTIKNLWSLYSAINCGDKSVLLDRMIAERMTRKDIEILIESISLPILEALDELKLNPLVHWSKEAYIVIGRDDIYKQFQMKVTVCDPNTDTFKLPFLKDSDHPPKMSDMMKNYSATPVTKCIYESDVLNMETERLRFGFGGFIEKIRIMLDATRVPDHFVTEQPDLSDDDLAAEHQAQVTLLIQRTLALAAGRAIYAYGTHVPDLTKILPIEPIVLSAKILPLRTVVTIDEANWTKESSTWPQFHNGVAAGLRISPSNNVNDSWIDFCNPAELEPQHGGVLLALGLNGTLKKLPLVDWYKFILQTCELVTVGFIMGAATAYRGTKDRKVTKVLSVHIPALLPPESAAFNHSNLIQATSLMGMGLLYMNSCDQKMVNVMLREIGKNAYTDPSTLDPDYEGCALAAGFALGLITLGAGNAPHLDSQLKNLYNLMTGRSALSFGDSHRNKEEEQPIGSINLDVTSPGATMALGLMYMKTEDVRVAEGVDILETRPYLNYVRPDFLLIRVVAKNLIMWSGILPSDAWIDSQLPDFIMNEDDHNTHQHYHQPYDQEVSKQAMYNIICGACLCIGLRYAGSKNEEAFKCLLRRLDLFIKLLNTQATTPQQHVTKSIIHTCIDVLCTAAAMVMAGTGNHELLSRLEGLHGRITDDMSYGNHMAVSMSLGLLFMGLGGYTLSTSNEAIAGLLCAFYPFYPTSTDDNRYHLQAFRHLWVMAVDSRWLMPFDVDNKKPCRVPMKLEIYDDDGGNTPQRKVRQVRIEAPSVVPDYKLIKSIQLDGERYWPLSVNMVPGKYQESIIKSGLIYVKRRKGKKSYEDDPYGKRNITW